MFKLLLNVSNRLTASLHQEMSVPLDKTQSQSPHSHLAAHGFLGDLIMGHTHLEAISIGAELQLLLTSPELGRHGSQQPKPGG